MNVSMHACNESGICMYAGYCVYHKNASRVHTLLMHPRLG